MKLCYVIILNYKRWDETVESVRSVFASSYPAVKVVVVDNASGNASLEQIRQALASADDKDLRQPALMDHTAFSAMRPADLGRLTLVQNHRNAGFAGGNNIAIRTLCQEDAWLCLLNPDMTLERDALLHLIRCAERKENSIVGTVHRSYQNPEKLVMYGGARVNYWSGNSSLILREKDIRRIQFISGGCLLTDAASYRTIGPLPEDYFLYWEETDWCYKATANGYSIIVCRDAISYDKRSTAIGNGFIADYFYVRNGLLFLRKYKTAYLPTAFALIFVRIAKKLLLGQTARARGSSRGIIDFLTGRRYENK